MVRAALLVALTALGAGACGEAPPERPATGERQEAIVGGFTDANHRYVVSVSGCTGTVISKHTILTAGHCYGVASRVSFGPTVAGAASVAVVQKVQNPLYADICDNDATYDLTVVKIADPAPVQAAPLLRATLDNSAKYVGPSWVFVGYGRTGPSGGAGTRRVTTFSIDLVGPAAGRGSLCDIPATLVYATAPGRNACNGDSGGPSFWVGGGVEYLAGVTSSGDNACMIDDTQQRSDQPYIDQFIQAQIDAFEGNDPCRSNGVCDESCNTGGELGDPDCAANHCGADGICAEACVAPRDPDCAARDSSNCGENGVCDPSCPTDPDCVRDCGRDGNCIPGCATPDPDCNVPPDAGARDAAPPPDDVIQDAGAQEASPDPPTSDGNSRPPPGMDATTGADANGFERGRGGASTESGCSVRSPIASSGARVPLALAITLLALAQRRRARARLRF